MPFENSRFGGPQLTGSWLLPRDTRLARDILAIGEERSDVRWSSG